jgi:hypothetical protein
LGQDEKAFFLPGALGLAADSTQCNAIIAYVTVQFSGLAIPSILTGMVNVNYSDNVVPGQKKCHYSSMVIPGT